MNYVWDATEDNQPDNSKVIGQTDDFIVKAKQMTRERIAVEHNFDFTVNGEQGSHRAGSARVWVSETQPANPIPSQDSETPGQLGVGRFWFKPSTGEAFVYTSTGWKGIGITGAQLLALLVSFAEKTSIATADKMLILDVAGGNVGKFVTFQTVLNTVLAERPWNDSAAVLQPSGVAAAGTSGAIARADHVHPKGDADTLDGLDSSYFQPASTAITTSNIASQSVSHATTADSATSAGNADTVDGQHASAFATAAQGAKADILSGTAGTYGYQLINSGGAWVIPAGTYMLYVRYGHVHLELYSGSEWAPASSGLGGVIISDGVNFRLHNLSPSYADDVYYRKLV